MIDMVLLALIAVSTLLGVMRGFVGIVAGTLAWLLAGWAAFQFGQDAAQAWAAPAPPGTGHTVGGYVLVFIAVLVVVSLVGMLVRAALRAVALGGLDRLLGGALGLVRGALICAVLLLAAGFTPLPLDPAWQDSRLRPALQPVVGWMQAQLPAFAQPGDGRQIGLPAALPPALDERLPVLPSPTSLAAYQRLLGKPAVTGDNGVLGEVVAGRGWPRHAEPAKGTAGGQATAPALPADIEPAPERPDTTAVAPGGSPGQARPASL